MHCSHWPSFCGIRENVNITDLSQSSVKDKPESFETVYRGSPMEALQRVSEVLSIYWELVTTSDSPVDWRCQQEYSDSFSSMTELPAESTTQYFT
ncbi:hypothetical protein GOODEAATRI_021583, partial [Goodea atripinnis]